MAVKVNSGDLKHKVVFKQPNSSLNEQSEPEITHTALITTWAKVERFNQFRSNEANITSLVGALDFYIRWSEDRDAIDKDWLITYKGQEYTIHEVELVEQQEKFLRFTAKVMSDG